MADIGSTLRETRIRKKIDITSVEEATKIRAKYLRALENEEFALLPGPTYAKTFLRTYAEYLGLDPRLLVEEYSARFERPEDLELPTFSREDRLRTRVTRVPPPSRWGLVLGVIAAILVFLLVLGLTGGDDDGGDANDGESRSTAERQRERGGRSRPQAGRRTRPSANGRSARRCACAWWPSGPSGSVSSTRREMTGLKGGPLRPARRRGRFARPRSR